MNKVPKGVDDPSEYATSLLMEVCLPFPNLIFQSSGPITVLSPEEIVVMDRIHVPEVLDRESGVANIGAHILRNVTFGRGGLIYTTWF
jgi:hypothetical protein